MSDSLQPAEGQCAFFLPKKRRFCRFRPNTGQKYCPEHACVLGVALERKRIVCPLNPKHTCYEDSLDKHLKKCNSRKRATEVYHEEGINAGSEEGDSVRNTQTAVKAMDTERLRQMIDKVNRLYEEHIGKVEEDIRSHECLRQEMDNPYFGLSALRHRRQQASLIGQLEGLGLLAPGHCYVEMGAGRGQLSHWVRQAVSSHDDASFLLVDRSSIRYKVDGYHKEEEKVKFERIKMDIEHLCLGKVPMVASSQRPLVAMGKHLCGAATDLTLRCLMETLNTSPDPSTSEPSTKRARTEDTPTGPTGPADTASSQSSSTERSGADNSQTSSANCDDGVSSHTVPDTSAEQGCQGKCDSFDRKEGVSEEVTENGEKMSSGQCDGETDRQQEKVKSDHVLGDRETKDCGTNVAENKRLEGVLIALCCHHQCRWKAYVGKAFMRQCRISADDFHLLTRLTSWAVCGWRDRDGSFGTKEKTSTSTSVQEGEGGDRSTADRSVEQTSVRRDDDNTTEEETEHNTADLVNSNGKEDGLQLTEKQKEGVGWRCKRLIDHGRVRYLRDQGLCSNLKVYIDAQQTPENVVLVATPTVTNK